MIIESPDEGRGYLGFSMGTLLPRFPFGRDNIKNILVNIFKVTGGLFKSDFGLFSHFGPVLMYRKLDHPMAYIYNTYICPL